MIGIGYADRTGAIGDVSADLGTINSYVGKLPDDIAALLDDPLFEAFADGPTQAISKIRAEDIKTPNTLGITGQYITDPGDGAAPFPTAYTPGSISFADMMLADADSIPVPFFADIFAAAHLSYVGGGHGGLGLSDYVQALVHNGEFTHHGRHPVKDFVSTVLDVTVVWAVIKAATGHDPITGEDLSSLERGVEAGMGLVNLVALLLAIPTGGGSLGGAAWARGAATAVLKTLLVNAIATGASVITFNTAIDLGLPSWAATLIALGVGFTIGVVGAKYVILGPKGEPVGKPIDIKTNTGYPVDGVIFSGDPSFWNKPPLTRGNNADMLLGNDVGHNFPVFDKFDFAAGTATSIKSLDTTAASYQSTSGLLSRLKAYVNDFKSFIQGTTDSGAVITRADVKSWILELAIPDAPLTSAQIAALDAAKAYANIQGVTLVITVIK